MGIFDRVEQEQFDNYKAKVSAEFSDLKTQLMLHKSSIDESLKALHVEIKSTATVSDETAKQAAASAIESQTNIKNIERAFSGALDEVQILKGEAEKLVAVVSDIEAKAQTTDVTLNEIKTRAHGSIDELTSKKLAVESEYQIISERATEFNSYLEQSKDLPSSLNATKELMADCKKLVDSMQSLLNHSIKKKSEIDELYREIYGEDISNTEGQIEHTSGKKDELDNSYNELRKELTQLNSTFKNSIEDINKQFRDLHAKNLSDFSKLLDDSGTRFKAVDEQLTGLLPGAMAAGLSAAYEEKKGDEIKSLESFDRAFRWAIVGMVVISCIPLGIDVFLVFGKGIDLLKVLKDTPTLLFAILPLYFPVLWLAYSSNKKSNLSKRLIEEYTHKSVLGKTYSGLSNQIENLQQNGDVKEELRTKLLFNVLQVSAENPGKLITNYSKSDHPLMDALENSVKLADSVNALAKIPGFSVIATKLAAKADDLLEENAKKVKRGMAAQQALEGESKNDENDEEDEEKSKPKIAA